MTNRTQPNEPTALKSVQPVLMSRDVAKSIRFFETLGFSLAFRDCEHAPRYAGMTRGGVELHLQWHNAKEWSYPVDRPTYRFVVDGVRALHQEFAARGIADMTTPAHTDWGTLEFHVRDPDGNGLQFYCDRSAGRE